MTLFGKWIFARQCNRYDFQYTSSLHVAKHHHLFGSPVQTFLHISCTLTTFLKLLYSEDERTKILRNICKYLPLYKA